MKMKLIFFNILKLINIILNKVATKLTQDYLLNYEITFIYLTNLILNYLPFIILICLLLLKFEYVYFVQCFNFN